MQSSDSSRKLQWLVWSGLGLIIVFIMMAFVQSKRSGSSGGTASNLPVYSQLDDFALTNQLGRQVTLSDLRGQVWVADIIFTRCAGPCPKMTRQMAELQRLLPAGQGVRLVSLTTDPEYDSPAVLGRYADRVKADSERWWFLTGSKEEIVRVAVDGLKLTSLDKEPEKRESPVDLFIHSTIFVVVDKQGRLRGTFQTQPVVVEEEGQIPSEAEAEKVWAETRNRILDAVKELLKE